VIERFNDGRDWFFERRFGLFVHWGLYALPGWHEQTQWRQNVARSDYVKLAERFNPVNYDPDAWLDLVESAGMEYLCLTTKHHDGFCLWDTKCTDFNVMRSPYGKDLVGMLAAACHRRGVKLCLYYSVADWHHPNYPNEGRHHELPGPEPGDEPNWPKYIEFLKAQIRELCTNYGELGGIWWDMNVPGQVDPSISAMIRELQPNAIVNDRGFDQGDYGTPERHIPEGRAFEKRTEACQSLGVHSWGYKHDEDYFSDKFMMQSLDRILAMGGNYLLNVGPKADGTIGEQETRALRRLGEWYGKVKESFAASPAPGLTSSADVLLTQLGRNVYVHLFRDPEATGVVLTNFGALPKKAMLLNTGQELEVRLDRGARMWHQPEYLRIRGLPVNELLDEVMVVKLEFEGGPV